jgi:RNA 2',3'-cyclic 3'-phosphodiesterase
LPPESENNIRAFIAIEVPSSVKESLLQLRDRLRPEIRGASWSRPDGFHLTFKFIGNISHETCDKIKEFLPAAARRDQFEVSFGRLGVFPNPRKARVLWVGLEKGARECKAVFESIEEPLEKLGFTREIRAFSPHLTLARFRNPGPHNPGLLQTEFSIPSFTADSVILFRSTLKPDGAVYTRLAEFKF